MDARSVINWAVVGQLSCQYLRAPTLDRCSLSQQSSSSVYSTIPSRGSISDSRYLSRVLLAYRYRTHSRLCDWSRTIEIHTHPFNGPFSGTTQVSRYQKGKTNLDFTEARDSEWQWHQQGHMQVCTSLQTDNHASTPPLIFLQAGCLSCRPTNSVKALKG